VFDDINVLLKGKTGGDLIFELIILLIELIKSQKVKKVIDVQGGLKLLIKLEPDIIFSRPVNSNLEFVETVGHEFKCEMALELFFVGVNHILD
jgi:hypothetical protein